MGGWDGMVDFFLSFFSDVMRIKREESLHYYIHCHIVSERVK